MDYLWKVQRVARELQITPSRFGIETLHGGLLGGYQRCVRRVSTKLCCLFSLLQSIFLFAYHHCLRVVNNWVGMPTKVERELYGGGHKIQVKVAQFRVWDKYCLKKESLTVY